MGGSLAGRLPSGTCLTPAILRDRECSESESPPGPNSVGKSPWLLAVFLLGRPGRARLLCPDHGRSLGTAQLLGELFGRGLERGDLERLSASRSSWRVTPATSAALDCDSKPRSYYFIAAASRISFTKPSGVIRRAEKPSSGKSRATRTLILHTHRLGRAGAGGGNRTLMGQAPRDFESRASTSFTTPATDPFVCHR